MSEQLSCVGLLGGGVIGGGWAARFLLNGIDVRLYDPDPRTRETIRRTLANARRAYGQLTAAPLPPEGSLSFVDSPESAVRGVEFVQESAPERVELKQRLLAAASRAAAPDVPFCSSTSGLRPSMLQAGMEHPERLIAGHPFNPVYLLPLVELCGGDLTDPAVITRAAAVYQRIGMHPLKLRTEIDGFLADRLLEALWREALWLVADDVATVEELDDAIRYGAGLRWAMMGTFLTYRIAGGEDGMRHFLEQFGPTLALPWTKLVDVPELDDRLLDKVVSQSDTQARGKSTTELERWRDDCLVGLLHALRNQRSGAGATVDAWERRLWRVSAAHDPFEHGVQALPLEVLTRDIPMQPTGDGFVPDGCCQRLLADATAGLLAMVGLDAEGGSFHAVETHSYQLAQLRPGGHVCVTSQVLDWDGERLRLGHRVFQNGGADPVATADQVLVHLEAGTGRSTPARGRVDSRLSLLADAHARLAAPNRASGRLP